MSNLVTKTVENIYKMNSDELDQVIEAIKLKRQYLTKQAVRSFVVGDSVRFKNRSGAYVSGTVKKVNRKYIVVHTQLGGYRVPATMLEAA